MADKELCGQESVYCEGDQSWVYACVKPAGHTPVELALVAPDGEPLYRKDGSVATGTFFDEHDYQLPEGVKAPANPAVEDAPPVADEVDDNG